MLPPPSVSAIVRWLPLATLVRSISVVAFVLPLGAVGSPQGPLDVNIAVVCTTLSCSSSPVIVFVSSQLPCPTTPDRRVFLGHHHQLIVTYIRHRCLLSIVTIRCPPLLSLIMLPPPSASAIVCWLPLATLACSVGVVAFVLPLGVAGSP
jgi:hypothetical protein